MRYSLAWLGLLTTLFTLSFQMITGSAIALPAQPEETTEHPADAIAWLHQGMVLAQLNLHSAALRLYNRAIQLMPEHSLAWVQRCASLNQLKRYEEAMIDCERALQGNGAWETASSAYAWSQRSYSLIGLEQYREAIASAERAIQLDSTYADAWNNQAVSLWRLGNYEEAAASIARAIELNPHNMRVQFNQREFGIRILAVKTAATGAKPTYVGSENPQSFGVRVGGLGSDSCEFIRQTFKPN